MESRFHNRSKIALEKRKHEDILNGLLAQVMVDAKNLLLGGVTGQFPVELVSGLEIVTEGLLDHDSLPSPRHYWIH